MLYDDTVMSSGKKQTVLCFCFQHLIKVIVSQQRYKIIMLPEITHFYYLCIYNMNIVLLLFCNQPHKQYCSMDLYQTSYTLIT